MCVRVSYNDIYLEEVLKTEGFGRENYFPVLRPTNVPFRQIVEVLSKHWIMFHVLKLLKEPKAFIEGLTNNFPQRNCAVCKTSFDFHFPPLIFFWGGHPWKILLWYFIMINVQLINLIWSTKVDIYGWFGWKNIGGVVLPPQQIFEEGLKCVMLTSLAVFLNRCHVVSVEIFCYRDATE